jgi:hypothetical protein
MNPAFEQYIGIDYSGAQTPSSSGPTPVPNCWREENPAEGTDAQFPIGNSNAIDGSFARANNRRLHQR